MDKKIRIRGWAKKIVFSENFEIFQNLESLELTLIEINGNNDFIWVGIKSSIPHGKNTASFLDLLSTVPWLGLTIFAVLFWTAETSDSVCRLELSYVALENVELVVATVSVEFQPEVMILVELKNDFVIDWGFDFEDVVLNNELKVEY